MKDTFPAAKPDLLEQRLRELCNTESGPYLRPFAPNPEWRTAQVFVVGTNPATPLRGEFSSFEEYWRALTRDQAAFDKVYVAQRQGKPSKTTGRACGFTSTLGSVSVLRTNACAYPTSRWKELRSQQKREQLRIGREILGALVETCRPAVILCHGKQAVQTLSELFSVSLDPYTPLDQQDNVVTPWTDGRRMRLFAYPHLSGVGVRRGFSVTGMDADLEALEHRLANELRPPLLSK